MDLNDWNHNGKHDAFDRYVDYELVNDSSSTPQSSSAPSDRGRSSPASQHQTHSTAPKKKEKEYHMSRFGALLCSLGGFLLSGVVLSATGNVLPAPVVVILWILFSIGLAMLFGYR